MAVRDRPSAERTWILPPRCARQASAAGVCSGDRRTSRGLALSGSVARRRRRLRPLGPSVPGRDGMASFHAIAGASETPEFPIVRRIGPADLKGALAEGLDDFWAMPTQVAFIGLVYPVAGLVLGGLAFGYNVLPLLFPLLSGFALVGPLVAIGLYELSRRREQGLPTDWKYAFEVLRSPAIGSSATFGVLLFVIFIGLLLAAQTLYEWLYGYRP